VLILYFQLLPNIDQLLRNFLNIISFAFWRHLFLVCQVVQFGVILLVELLLILNTIFLTLHASIVQVVWIHPFTLRFGSLGRVLLCLILFLSESTENIFRFLRRAPTTINFRNRLVSLLLLLNFQLLQCAYFLLSYLLVVKLIIYKLLGGTILLSLRIRHKSALFLLSKLDVLLNLINLLILSI